MAFWDFLNKKNKNNNNKFHRFEGLNWQPASYYTPAITDVFETDVVQQVIWCITQEAKKLEPRHVIRKENGYKLVNDNIQSVLDDPNVFMTTADFIEKVIYNLLTTNNSFVLPVWDNGALSALHPLQPVNVDFIQDITDSIFIKFTFSNGYESTVHYQDVIHIRYNFGANEFLGGNSQGKPDVKAIKNAAQLNETLLKGVQKSLASSYAVNGVVKYNTMMDEGKTEAALAELTKKLNNNESGFMPLDLKAEFIPFNKDVKMVDEATLKFIDEKLLRFYGVSLSILTGDFTTAQYEAFYQKVLEPIVITLNQAFSKTLFSKRETFSFGHKIIFYTSKLNFMSMSEKERIGTLLSNTGAATRNEIRHLFGLEPREDCDELVMSKNFGSADSVKDMVDKEIDAIKSVNKKEDKEEETKINEEDNSEVINE